MNCSNLTDLKLNNRQMLPEILNHQNLESKHLLLDFIMIDFYSYCSTFLCQILIIDHTQKFILDDEVMFARSDKIVVGKSGLPSF